MKAKIFLIMAFLALLSASAYACAPGYYCDSYSTPGGYYSYEAWDGYVKWDYTSPRGEYYSYFGPSYFGPSYYGGYYPSYYYADSYYYPGPSTYYYGSSYGYYPRTLYYSEPGFYLGFGW